MTRVVTAALACAALVGGVEANPKGGTVASGQATISQAPGQTTIHQKSNKAIINWKNFDIDHGETTTFVQPGSKAIALNRIDSKNPSLINGRLEANGNIWVINPSGVVFGPTAKVDVHGIVATTSDILDSDFLNDRFSFSIPSANPNAAVINQGSISIGGTGLAGLVAPHVRNEGLIDGILGQVVLAGAPTFSLDFQGDGLIQFAATSKVIGEIDPGRALVDNTGTIRADGGRVLLTADAAAGVVDEVINTSGVIEARSVSQDRGVIVLHGGDNGIVAVSGKLDASGTEAGTRGGEVDIRGEKLLLAGGALIDSSGHSGGGVVRVGGDPRGEGAGDTAKQTTVAAGATINADATSVGDGGDVVVWADDRLVFAGEISARGGPEGGDGGHVETSSPGTLVAMGTVDTGAVAGEAGKWLLDPQTVRIVDGAGTDDLPVFEDDPPADGKATVSAQSIGDANGKVEIEATQNIIVDAGFLAQHDVVLKARTVNFMARIESKGTVTIITKNIKVSDDIKASGNPVITGKRLNIIDLAGGDHPTGGAVELKTAVDVLAIGQVSTDGTPFGHVIIKNTRNLVIDGEGNAGVSAGMLQLTVDGTLTLNRPISAEATGNAIVLVTDRLINRVGRDALTTPNGRALVYSVDPKKDMTNGIPAKIIYRESIQSAPPEALPDTGNWIVYTGTNIPLLSDLTSVEVNVVTDPVVVSPSELSQSESVALAAPSPTVFTLPSTLDSAGSQDLLFSNDGNYELWGISGPQ